MKNDRAELDELLAKANPADRLKVKTEWKNRRRPKTNGKGATKRSKVLPIRVEPEFKELLKQISVELKNKNRRFNTMTDVITAAVTEYALRNYPDVYNTIYPQTSF